MASAPGSLYALLSLAPTATADEIRSAYLRLAKAHHPDRATPEQHAQATRDFQELARAYKTLSDPELRKAYDRTLEAASSAPAPLSKPAPPLPRRPRSPSSSFAPSFAAYQHRHEHFTPDSPFPGFRVPPGGYPADPLPLSASAVPTGDLGGYAAAPHRRRDRSWSARPPRAAYSPAPAPAHGFAYPAFLAEDPFALFQRVLDEQERFLRDAFSRSGVEEGGGGMRCEGRGVVRRREWNEGGREANGDAILLQGHEEVEQGADGGIRWRGESTTIAFTTGRPYDHRPDSYPPAFPSSSSYRRPPSPARIPPSPGGAQSPVHAHRPCSSSFSRPDGAGVPRLAHAHAAPPLRRPPSPAHHPLLPAPLAAPLAVPAPQHGYRLPPPALPPTQQPHHEQRRLTHPSAPAPFLPAPPLRAPSPAHRPLPLPAPAAPPLRLPKSPAGPPSPYSETKALVPRASAQQHAARTRGPLTLEYGERPASPLFGFGDERDGAAVARRGAGGGGAREGFERQWRKREREGVV